ncbi:ATP-binding protein [Actinacidiphila sp. bgisy160]|uniref:ATP-binding protein n=1 Tax=Actinacidiphila sp. bgisy160 TaxID=3413796 RepID=UPI003D714688
MEPVDAGEQPGRRSPSAEEERWTLAHRPAAPAEARRLTREALQRWKVPAETADEVLLVVSELVTNAVEHARPPIVLHVDRDSPGGQVRVEVTDGGPAASKGEWAASCSDSEHGRGLSIVHQVASAHGEPEGDRPRDALGRTRGLKPRCVRGVRASFWRAARHGRVTIRQPCASPEPAGRSARRADSSCRRKGHAGGARPDARDGDRAAG